MKQTIVEIIKSNKKAIIKKVAIIGGSAVVLSIATALIKSKMSTGDDEAEMSEEMDEAVEGNDESIEE